MKKLIQWHRKLGEMEPKVFLLREMETIIFQDIGNVSNNILCWGKWSQKYFQLEEMDSVIFQDVRNGFDNILRWGKWSQKNF